MELTKGFLYLPLALLIALSRCMGVNLSNKDVLVHHGGNVTLDCDVPTNNCSGGLKFLWQYAGDKPLEGTKNKRSYTFHSVQIKDEGHILCTTSCNRNPSKDKTYQLSIYSFPSEPVLKWKHPLVAGDTASITCEVSNVYPSDRMTIALSKDGIPLGPTHSNPEEDSDKPETIRHDFEFVPTSEDSEKNITCIASLDLSDKGHGIIQKISLPVYLESTEVPTTLMESSTIPVSSGSTIMHTSTSESSTVPVSSGSTVMHTSTSESSTVPASSGATKVPTSSSDGSTTPVYSGRTTVSMTLSEISTIPASSDGTTVPVSPKKNNTFSALPGHATPFYSHYTDEEKLWLPFAVVSPVAIGLILGSLLKRRKNKSCYQCGTTAV